MPLRDLFEQNREWAGAVEKADPGFFSRLAAMQAPEYLWIGCADSRVPANEIVGLLPGELFVHRNVGNVVVHSDLNCLSVIQFAVEVLGVSHIMVVGHHRCGAVRAALQTDRRMGLIDHWLRHIEDVAVDRADVLAAAAQVPLAIALLYAANAGAVAMSAVYGVHALVVLVMLADRGLRKDALARAWWGAELVALMLWLL